MSIQRVFPTSKAEECRPCLQRQSASLVGNARRMGGGGSPKNQGRRAGQASGHAIGRDSNGFEITENTQVAGYQAARKHVVYLRYALAMPAHTPDTRRVDRWAVFECTHQQQSKLLDRQAKSPRQPSHSTNPGELNPTLDDLPRLYQNPG